MNMKNDVWIGKKGFRFWYYRFRDSEYYALVIISLTLIVSIFLIFNIIVPEITQWFSIRDAVIATRQRIAVLQQNINFINNLDKNMLNTQLQTVSHALPPEKNFGFMLNAITNAAANSGVSLNDYSFQVGNINSSQKQTGSTLQKGVSSIEVTVIVNGNIGQVRQFINSLENNLPISEVSGINGSGNNISVRIAFYQKPFTNVTFSGDTPLAPISSQKADLLRTLSKWDNTTDAQNSVPQSSSSSAVPLF